MTAALIDRTAPVLRFSPCPQCADRRRILVESGDALLGQCLGCGRMLPAPLATENVESLATAAPGR
jgi:uncharacterized Zn finger protein